MYLHRLPNLERVRHELNTRMFCLRSTPGCARPRLYQTVYITPRWTSNIKPVASESTFKAKAGKSVTKKHYEDLPKRHVLATGEPAPPLPSWAGGLEQTSFLFRSSSKPPDSSPRQERASNTHTFKSSCPLNPTPRRRRGRAPPTGDLAATKWSAVTDLHESLQNTQQRVAEESAEPSEDEASEGNRARRRRNASQPDSVEECTLPVVTMRRVKRLRRSKSSVADEDTAPESNAEQLPCEDMRPPRNQLAKEILENLARFPHCILLTRVGQFYESYFDQAQEVSRLLSIKLTKRTWDGQRIWMCGFPLMHLDKHLKTLVLHCKRPVAMCEEFPRSREPGEGAQNVKTLFDRRVIRVLTPGTLIDESFVNPYANNYLLAISTTPVVQGDDETSTSTVLGLAWIDVSTGEFFSDHTSTDCLRDYLVRISPQEVVLDRSLEALPGHVVRVCLAEEGSYLSYADLPVNDPAFAMYPSSSPPSDNILPEPNTSDPVSNSVYSEPESSAIALLTDFLRANLLDHAPRQLSPSRESMDARMQIDAYTIKALEIREGMREGGATGSLMSVVKRTVTTSGTRLLARWLCSPSTSLNEINARQSLVDLFLNRPSLRDDVVESLRRMEDASRILQKFLLGRGDVDDLSSMRRIIEVWESIKSRILMEKTMELQEQGSLGSSQWASLDTLILRMADLKGLSQRILLAVEDKDAQRNPAMSMPTDEGNVLEHASPVDEELPANTTPQSDAVNSGDTKWTIKPQYSPELAALHAKLKGLKANKDKLQLQYQIQYNAPSLTLRTSPSHGMHVHIAKAKSDLDRLKKSQQFIPIAESNSTKAFFNQAWFSLGNSIFETTAAIISFEKEAFTLLRTEVTAEAGAVRKTARIFDELDVTSAFSNLASDLNFVKPVLTNDKRCDIVNGRHPTVELGLLNSGRIFTPNSLSLTDLSRLHIITGPNMAGKSTFLRQVAVITILAQTGSFVPADRAEIGLVDSVFSRIGARDDLFRDRSTFMVEMLETAEILRRATDRSLVIMDEVGRGTTVTDGLAIAFATVHYLYFKNRCRALFATHFHEIADMLGYSDDVDATNKYPEVGFYCTNVDETRDGRFVYSHRLRPGVNRDSHGLKVAQLGGMPSSAVKVASHALTWLKSRSRDWTTDTTGLKALGKRLAEGDD